MANDIQSIIDKINNKKGLGLKDLSELFKAVETFFGIQTSQGDILSGLFPKDVLDILESITVAVPVFNSGSDGSPRNIKCIIKCENSGSGWSVIPDVFVIDQISLTIEIVEQSISAVLNGNLELEGIPLMVEADFPSMFVKAEMIDENPDAANKLLKKFNAAPSANKDLKGLTLTQLFLLADPANRKAVIRLGLGGIELGPGVLALQGALNYTGKPSSQITGYFWGEYDIQPKGCQPYALTLMAEFDGPGQGWKLEGGAGTDPSDTSKPVAGIADIIEVFDKNIKDVPSFLHDLKVINLDIAYETETKNCSFSCDVEVDDLFGKDSSAEMIVSIEMKRNNPGETPAQYEKTFTGQLIFKLENGMQMEFDILFDTNQSATGTDTVFIAAYKNLAGGRISIGALTSQIDPGLNIPLTINLKDAFFVYDKKSTATTSNILFGLDIGTGINLSNLPLIGELLHDGQALKIGVQPLIASGGTAGQAIFSKDELDRVESLIPGGGINLPKSDIKATVSLGINLQAGGVNKQLTLPIVLNKAKAKPIPQGQNPPKDQPPIGDALEEGQSAQNPPAEGGANAPVEAPSANGDITWINLQKAFGPVQFNRAGFAFKDSKIHGYLDAALGIGGLTLSLDGLGVSTPINKFDPSFSLMGIGLDFKEGAIEIGGSFLRTKVTEGEGAPYDEYDGIATIKAEILDISAIGSYARVNGHNSLFIYAILNYPIGGPQFFFVTGLAAGFGYNRAIRMPDITQVATFPLVNEAVNGAGSGPPGDSAGRRNYLQTEITKLRTSIYPKIGEYFLAAGIKFTSYEMIDSFVMVAVQFGKHFEIDLLGLSTMAVPTPEAAQTVTPIAEIQMALKAVFDPSAGVLGVEAQLTNNSFLFSRACHLTGGFAFYVWFGGPHEGDFVITIGGYHPLFNVPAYYPVVPRLGFNWVISSILSLKGEAYFALTAHALMAGGKLEALFHTGPVKAWFIIGADFIISWKPYFYDAHIYLDMGVSVTFWLFGKHTITVHIGADLHVWGPDFSGIAKVHLWIITFTVKFGDAAPKPRPIDWATFKSSFLPKPEKILKALAAGGVLKQKDNRTLMNPKELLLTINSMVPIMTYELHQQKGPASTTKDKIYFADPTHQHLLPISEKSLAINEQNTSTFGIAPMAVDKVSSSNLEIIITRDQSTVPENYDFAFKPILKRVPKAMWGDKLTPETNQPQFIENALCGFEIRPASPDIPGETHPVLKQELQYEIDANDNAYENPVLGSFNDAGKQANFDNIQSLGAKRLSMMRALGLNPDALNLDIPDDIESMFVQQPIAATFS